MSVYDPQGIAAPVTLTSKILQRELFPRKDEDPNCTHALGWADPIASQFHKEWDKMVATYKAITTLSIPRSFYPKGHANPFITNYFIRRRI